MPKKRKKRKKKKKETATSPPCEGEPMGIRGKKLIPTQYKGNYSHRKRLGYQGTFSVPRPPLTALSGNDTPERGCRKCLESDDKTVAEIYVLPAVAMFFEVEHFCARTTGCKFQ